MINWFLQRLFSKSLRPTIYPVVFLMNKLTSAPVISHLHCYLCCDAACHESIPCLLRRVRFPVAEHHCAYHGCQLTRKTQAHRSVFRGYSPLLTWHLVKKIKRCSVIEIDHTLLIAFAIYSPSLKISCYALQAHFTGSFFFSRILILLLQESDQSAVRACLGVASHPSTTP